MIYFISSKKLDDEPEAIFLFDSNGNKLKTVKEIDMNNLEGLETICNNQNPSSAFDDDSLIIFDDYEGIYNKKIGKFVEILKNSILVCGRSRHLNCLISCHTLNAGTFTKLQISECNKIVLFPKGLTKHAMNYYLKQYLNFNVDLIHKLLNLKSILTNKYPFLCINLKNITKY